MEKERAEWEETKTRLSKRCEDLKDELQTAQLEAMERVQEVWRELEAQGANNPGAAGAAAIQEVSDSL